MFDEDSTRELTDDTYLFCLSRDGDNLYQWRSYTPQGGIAIGFDRRELYSAIQNGFAGQERTSASDKIVGMLVVCRYNDDVAKRVVERLNQRQTKNHGCSDGCKGFGLYMMKVMRILFAQKNPSFMEEQEERFLVRGAPRAMVEIIKGKPRILVKDLGISKSIKCIRLSPHGDRERNQLLVEILRDKNKLTFQIEHSKSSYNGR